MLLSIMREYRMKDLDKRHTDEALSAIEHFHFVFTAVTSQRSSGGISQMYALHARRLLGAHTLDEKLQGLRELTEKLRTRRPSFEEFEADFARIRFLDTFTKQRNLVRYILTKIARYHETDVVIDYENMTIEHLGAQRGKGADRVADDYCGQIGNLVLVSSGFNSNQLRNRSFSEKRDMLLKSRVWLGDQVENASSWGEDQIDARTKHLAKLAYDTIWRF